jgi:hypothetical protein
VSRLARPKLSRRRLTLRGTARDRGCAGLARVSISVALHKRHRCRFLKKNGRLGKARKCKRIQWIPAKGKRAWRLSRTRRLPKGTYTIQTRATDKLANKEKKRTKTNFKRLQLR